MGNNRAKKIWGMEARDKGGTASVVDPSRAAAKKRAKCKKDFRYFYREVLAQEVKDKRSGLSRKQSLGKIHDLLMDFLSFEAEGLVRYSRLMEFMPEYTEHKDGTREYQERWIYFPTLDSEPSVQDGPEGPISRMFYESEKLWTGVVIRICGDGLTKCILMPRGHLKSTLCNQAFNLWQIVRDPSARYLIRSLTCTLARSFIADIKFQFEMNERFKALFGDLGPPAKREFAWNADFIQVRASERRGKEPTLSAMGMESEITGGHFDGIMLDDVVGESNTKTADLRADARARVQRLQAVRDPDTPLFDIGTRWEEDDVHSMFLARDSEMRDDCSFIVATVLDADGQPLWPEKFTPKAIERLRRSIPEDRIFYGQYYNQFTGTSARTFRPEWLRTYEGDPARVAEAKRLNIYIGWDTASGKREQEGKLDYTACLVIGQTEDRLNHYVLDGLNEKLPAEQIAKAIVDMANKWRAIIKPYGGSLVVGVEDTAYTSFLQVALDYEQRSRGADSLFSIESLKHDKRSNLERIRVLAWPYSNGRILWPHNLWRPGVSGVGAKGEMLYGAASYDLIEQLKSQYTKCPSLTYDDLLTAHAYAVQMATPPDFFRLEPTKGVYAKDPSVFTREQALRQSQEESLGGYEAKGDWRLGL